MGLRYVPRKGEMVPAAVVEELASEIHAGASLASIERRTGIHVGALRKIRDGTYGGKRRKANRKSHPDRLSDERIAMLQELMDAEPETTTVDFAERFGINKHTLGCIRNRTISELRVQRAQKGDRPLFCSRVPKRCPTCGGMVFMPCLRCKLNKDQPMRAERSYGLALVLDGKSTRRPYR